LLVWLKEDLEKTENANFKGCIPVGDYQNAKTITASFRNQKAESKPNVSNCRLYLTSRFPQKAQKELL
jgi:hypothetical protein